MPPSTSPTPSAARTSTPSALHEGIPVSTLVVGTVIPFDLFTEIDGSALLYRGAGDEFTQEQRDALRDTPMRDLLVRRADLERYYQYIAGNLVRLLQGQDGTRSSPGDVHDTSVMVAGRAIDAPTSRPAFDMACQVIANAVDLTAQVGGVLRCISEGTPGLRELPAHSMRVCFYGLQLARGIGIDDTEELSDLGVGLMLHDLGKVKSKGIEVDDVESLADHPARGLERIREAPFVGRIARDVIEHHHERLDGQGLYRLAAAQWTVHARIAAVADAFDRRTVDRAGRMLASSFEALRAMIAEEKGAFDPKLLALFVRTLSR